MAGKPRAMLTLTVSSKNHETPDDAAQALKDGLRLLRLRLQRHPRFIKFAFLAVFERHKSGYPHLHLVIRGGFIPWKWLRKAWEEITGSTGIDIRKIGTKGQAAFYVAKYIGKDLSAFEGCKRWWRSHDYNSLEVDDWQPEVTAASFERWQVSFNRLAITCAQMGWTLEKTERERWLVKPPPGTPWRLPDIISVAAREEGAFGTKVPW